MKYHHLSLALATFLYSTGGSAGLLPQFKAFQPLQTTRFDGAPIINDAARKSRKSFHDRVLATVVAAEVVGACRAWRAYSKKNIIRPYAYAMAGLFATWFTLDRLYHHFRLNACCHAQASLDQAIKQAHEQWLTEQTSEENFTKLMQCYVNFAKELMHGNDGLSEQERSARIRMIITTCDELDNTFETIITEKKSPAQEAKITLLQAQLDYCQAALYEAMSQHSTYQDKIADYFGDDQPWANTLKWPEKSFVLYKKFCGKYAFPTKVQPRLKITKIAQVPEHKHTKAPAKAANSIDFYG